MPLFQSSDLARFFSQGENEISTEKPFLVDRTSPAIATGTSVYTLPDYVASIRRVSYLGKKLDPLPRRNQREVFQAANQSGTPFWYVYNNIGANQIKLFPTPLDNFGAAGTDLWAGPAITSYCIVEFYRATDNSTFTIQPFLRPQLLKYYAAKRAYSIDGPGMNLKLVKYYNDKWNQKKVEFSDYLDELYSLPRKILVDEIVSSNYFPGEPVLPINQFGVSVDEGY